MVQVILVTRAIMPQDQELEKWLHNLDNLNHLQTLKPNHVQHVAKDQNQLKVHQARDQEECHQGDNKQHQQLLLNFPNQVMQITIFLE